MVMDQVAVAALTRRRFGLAAGGVVVTLVGLGHPPDAAAKPKHRHGHGHVNGTQQVKDTLDPEGDSGISGFVTLHARKNKQAGTSITVHANGLTPGVEYISLYYDNAVCELEPYSA